jgi:hypothetical protein
MDVEAMPPGADRNALEKALQRGSVFDAVRTAHTAQKLSETMASAKRLKTTRSEERGLWDSFRIAERRIYVQEHGEPTRRSLKWAERLTTKGADLKKAALAIAALPPKEKAYLTPLLSRAQFKARKVDKEAQREAQKEAQREAGKTEMEREAQREAGKAGRMAIIRTAREAALKAAEENPTDQKAVAKAALWEDTWEILLDVEEHIFRAPYAIDDAIVGQDPDGHYKAEECLREYSLREWEVIAELEKLC